MLNTFLALGAIGMQIASVVLVIALLFRRRSAATAELVRMAGSVAIPLSFFLALSATGLSLYHSEIVGIVPCGLCWLQRVFIYPQVVLYTIAMIRKDAGVWLYGFALSLFGALVALYHHFLQVGISHGLPCPAAPGAADCAKRILFEFGYVTYPMLALSLCIFVAFLMLALRVRRP